MNLIHDAWIPVIRANGETSQIAPWQIAETDNPVIEINAPRPDFQGALYQFIIGLLQTCFAPEDEDDWLELWETPPTQERLQEALEKVAFAFELDNPDGAAFLQDYELKKGKEESIELLLIGAPGTNTTLKNTDLFQKRNQVCHLCSSCAATALYTLQTNGPPGGSGHMVGVRGNGPLTTLVMSRNEHKRLFHDLWLNVLSDISEMNHFSEDNIFPWTTKTRTSESCTTKKCKEGCPKCGTYPEDTHPLHVYWAMPRRIRLIRTEENGICDICSKQVSGLFNSYITVVKGYRYVGAWKHPLTPYQKTKDKIPNPLKGGKLEFPYQHWNGLVFQDVDSDYHAAKVVNNFISERVIDVQESQIASLWCFGFDMEPGKAKSRCWYESRLPLFHLDKQQQNNLMFWASELINAAREVIKILRTRIKEAWFKRPKDAKGDMSVIDRQFWGETEADFFRLLEQLARLPGDTGLAPPEIYQTWFNTLQREVFQLFDSATIATVPEDLDLKRIIRAKNTLRERFYGNKAIKTLKTKMQSEEAA